MGRRFTGIGTYKGILLLVLLALLLTTIVTPSHFYAASSIETEGVESSQAGSSEIEGSQTGSSEIEGSQAGSSEIEGSQTGSFEIEGSQAGNVEGKDFPDDYDESLLLDLVDGTEDGEEDMEDEDEPYDWDEILQSMTEQDAGLGLDFAKTRREYNVVVSVASTGADEECGSDENFYFQLIFEKGSSGVVLANMQLTSDGFRTGKDEAFRIRTNRDYGDLQSVRIIPMPADEGVFDKLKIDHITVYETDQSGVSDKWMVEEVGWIGGQTAKLSAENAYENKPLTEIARDYGVTGNGTTVNLLVCLGTTDYSYEDELAVQYEGMVKGQIDYLSTSGYYRTKIFDVVEAIKAYNTSEEGYEVLVQSDAYETESLMQSDPNQMFRPYHMDRFVVTLEDLEAVDSISFSCNSNVSTTWGIESVSLSLIKEAGILVKNPNDECIRESVTQPFAVNRTSLKNPAYRVACTESGVSSVTIPFTENGILTDEETGEREILEEGTAASMEDGLNLFIFPNETGDNAGIGEYNLASALQYTDVYGTSHQVSAAEGKLQKVAYGTTGSSMFYCTEMAGTNISSLSRLLVSCPEDGDKAAMIDHAIVQRIRGNTVVGTYYFEIEADVRGIIKNTCPTSIFGKNIQISSQVLTIQFSEDTQQTVLQSGVKDVSLAISYVSALSPGNETVESAAVSLAEMGIRQIGPGKVVSIPFMEPYAGEVLGISGIRFGEFNVGINAAYLTNLESDSDYFSEGYFSFADGLELGAEMSTAEVTASSKYEKGAVLPLRIVFETADADKNMESGADGGVSVRIGYIDMDGEECNVRLGDIRDYMVDEEGSLSAGGECEILTLLTNVADLSNITIMTDSSGWSLARVTAKLGDGILERSRRVDGRVTSSGLTIDLKLFHEDTDTDADGDTEADTDADTEADINTDTEENTDEEATEDKDTEADADAEATEDKEAGADADAEATEDKDTGADTDAEATEDKDTGADTDAEVNGDKDTGADAEG